MRLESAEWARQWARDGRPGSLTLPELVRLGFVRRPGQFGRPLRVFAPLSTVDGTGRAEALARLAGAAARWGGLAPGK